MTFLVHRTPSLPSFLRDNVSVLWTWPNRPETVAQRRRSSVIDNLSHVTANKHVISASVPTFKKNKIHPNYQIRRRLLDSALEDKNWRYEASDVRRYEKTSQDVTNTYWTLVLTSWRNTALSYKKVGQRSSVAKCVVYNTTRLVLETPMSICICMSICVTYKCIILHAQYLVQAASVHAEINEYSRISRSVINASQ